VVQGPLSGCGSELRVQVADPHEPSCRQERSKQPSPNPLRRICFWQRNGYRRAPRAAAGSGRSEHRNVDILIPLARPRESPTGPNVPCERRTDPAEPPPPTSPRRQPQHSNTAKKVRVPGVMRRSFRTHRLCAIPGVSPRAGMRCPVGAHRTPHLSQSPHALTPSRPQRPHHNTPDQRRLFFLNGDHQTIP
jgi:hypothetical protein